jgi:hypothetical protein
MEIEKRLKRSSIERSDSEEKRRLPDHEAPAVVRRQNSQRDDVKNIAQDANDGVEPTSLTFEQKRLSFERGISVDKVVLEGGDSADKVKQEEKFKTDVDEKFEIEEKPLSFAEKRLSFEQSNVSQEKKESTPSQPQRSTEDKRRDSELFEGVSVGLGKLDVERDTADQCKFSLFSFFKAHLNYFCHSKIWNFFLGVLGFLSPKPGSTPPPSPAEFKKQDSIDSDKSSKRVSGKRFSFASTVK